MNSSNKNRVKKQVFFEVSSMKMGLIRHGAIEILRTRGYNNPAGSADAGMV